MIRLSRRHIVFAGALATLGACGKDSSSTTGPSGNLTGNTIVIDSVSQGQSVVVGGTITIGFRVMNSTVTAGVPNQVVTIAPAVGSGTVAPTSVTSDANGHGAVVWTLGTTSGINTITLSATGVSANATATALAAPPTKLVRVSTDSQTVVASASTSLIVRSTDQFGNAVPNVPVSWTSNGGTITPTSTTTGPSGNAAITFTTGPIPTTYSITATSPGLTPVTFTLKGS
jgi:Bacterial Ig-like domain (group 1)